MREDYRSREDPPGESKFNRSTWNFGRLHINWIDSKFINRKALGGPTFNVKVGVGRFMEGQVTQTSDKDWTTLLILSILLGSLGADRFYAGHIGLGVLKLLTLGACGIWGLIDIIFVATGKFVDDKGLPIVNK